MALPDALTARLSGLARVATDLDARADLADARAQLRDLQARPNLTTAAGQALAAITAEKRAAERAARAAELRSLPTLADAEAHAAANQRTPR